MSARRLVSGLALLAGLGITSAGIAPFAAAQATVVSVPPAEAELQARLARAELLAGLTPVEGPGIAVILRNSPRPLMRGVDPAALKVRERDLLAVVNALRNAGAEAIAVEALSRMGRVVSLRLTAESAWAESSTGIRLNGLELVQPFRVLAIGPGERLRVELTRAGGVIRTAGLDELKMVEIQISDRLVLPARVQPTSLTLVRAIPPESVPEPLGIGPGPAGVTGPAVVRRPTTPPPTSPGGTAVTRPVLDGTAPAVPIGPGVVYGGRGLPRYHVGMCRFGTRLNVGQRVFFTAEPEAMQAGRDACPYCARTTASP